LIGNGYADLAAGIVEQAMAAGATDAECTISEGEEFSANVRLRELETLKEAGSRAVGLRILQGRHTGSAHTSDFSADGLRHMVRSAIELAAITSEDPHAGLPDPSDLGSIRRAAPKTPHCAPIRASPIPKARPSTPTWAAAPLLTRADSRASIAPAIAL